MNVIKDSTSKEIVIFFLIFALVLNPTAPKKYYKKYKRRKKRKRY